jgi:hypothetical protein
MRINLSHVRIQGVDCAVFDADATSRSTPDRTALLNRLTIQARLNGLHVVKSALAYASGGRIEFFGTTDLVNYLASGGPIQWTHWVELS